MSLRSSLSRILVPLLLASSFLSTPIAGQAVSSGTGDGPYHKEKLGIDLRQKIDQASITDHFTVVIRGQSKPDLDAIKFRGDEVVAALKAAAAKSQGPLVTYLQTRGARILNQFWITDAVLAEVDKPTLQGLTNLSSVFAVHENFTVNTPPHQPSASAVSGEVTWGLEKIAANRVWSELGFTGQGVRVAVLDTGVEISHPDLAGKMATDNPGDPNYPGGWIEFDSNGAPVVSQPHDTAGHGTHTSGTVLGGNTSGTQIGVAPDATLMHALILPDGSGTFAQVVAGMQWAVEPTDAAGAPAGQRPQIASMSWGADGAQSDMVEPLRNMYFAGVLPIAAAGNCGANCIGTPGAIFEAFGIGASAADDSIADFSSGSIVSKSDWLNPPGEWPDQWVKPDLSAPGVDVYSSVPGGGYEIWSGTSMATPHVAGTAALMLSANPSLTPDAVLAALKDGSEWNDRYGPDRPNIRLGWGRINAFESVSRVAYKSGIAGTITDSVSGAPLDQVRVNVSGTPRFAMTKPDGTFYLVLPAGGYTLDVERFGYEKMTLGPVTVEKDQISAANTALKPLPTGVLRGRVTFARTGSGIPGAKVQVPKLPIRLEQQTDADGRYEFRLPAGTYSLSVDSFGFNHATAGSLSVAVGETTEQDFALTAQPRVAVVGDPGGLLTRFLNSQGYLTDTVELDVRYRIGDYSAVIVNMPSKVLPEDFTGLVDAAAEAGVGMIFTNGYWYGWGIDLLQNYYGDPATTGSAWWPVELKEQVLAEHPDLLPGRKAGDAFTLIPSWTDVGWFDNYSGEVLTELGDAAAGIAGKGVAVKQNANNRHVLLASLGVQPWFGPDNWSEDGRQLFLSAIRWVARPEPAGPKFVEWDLKASPETLLWYQPATVTVGVKNVGETEGTAKVDLYVNSGYEAGQPVTLKPDQYQTASFTVLREPVGSYKVQVGHLTAAFRIRPPRVTVTASTISLPASGKGKNSDPGETAIPLAGAKVSLVENGATVARGTLDGNGTVTFDSTASRAAYTIVVTQNSYGYNVKRNYFLTLPVHVEDDASYTFAPQAADTALLTASMHAANVNQHGSVFLANSATSNVAFEFPAGPMVLTPGEYRLANVIAYDVPGAQWAYASLWNSRTLAAGASATYDFGGDLALRMNDVLGQAAPKANVDWAMTDGYGHGLAGMYQVTAGAFGPLNQRLVGNTATWPATIAETASTTIKPVLTLTNPAGVIEQTGPINWSEQPKSVSFVTESVAPGEYSLLLTADTGPYMGILKANASLMLPARSVTRTMVRPGDTFEVTVLFDAGESGDIVLSETLPTGFTVLKESSVPAAIAGPSTWTWHPSGKGSYRSGQTVKVTYTVKVGPDVKPAVYNLIGSVSQNGVLRAIAGIQAIQVIP